MNKGLRSFALNVYQKITPFAVVGGAAIMTWSFDVHELYDTAPLPMRIYMRTFVCLLTAANGAIGGFIWPITVPVVVYMIIDENRKNVKGHHY